MIRNALLGILLSTGLLVAPASAGYVVSATQTYTPDVDGTDYDYTITLSNASSSTLNVGTFWYAWVPGKNFMVNRPSSESSPTGWVATVTHGGTTDGYAIQWKASSSSFYLAPGGSLTFSYVSAETPTQLAGNSPLYPTFPEETSFVYSGAPFSDTGNQFVVGAPSAVPEPSSMILTLLGGLAWVVRGRVVRLVRA